MAAPCANMRSQLRLRIRGQGGRFERLHFLNLLVGIVRGVAFEGGSRMERRRNLILAIVPTPENDDDFQRLYPVSRGILGVYRRGQTAALETQA